MKSGTSHYLFYPIESKLVTCRDEANKRPNALVIDWAMPASFDPFLVVISVGKTRYSHDLISEEKEFVLCVMPFEEKEKVLMCGTTSGRDVDKFEESGLTAMPAKHVKAPLVKEALACLECKVIQAVDAGDHTLFVGEVLEVHGQGTGKKLFDVGGREFVGL